MRRTAECRLVTGRGAARRIAAHRISARRIAARRIAVTLGVLVSLAGCSHAPRPTAAPDAAEEPKSFETGYASYYASSFDGRRTASGERYRDEALTAAHRTLPFGTVIRVTNLENGRSVEVVINDRGPHRKGRIVDLSRRAAAALGFLEDGLVRVQVDVLEPAER